MAKKVLTTIKLQANAGQASPAPPVGPALGQHGINIMEFCKAFNAQTQSETGTVIPVVITVYEDRSFTFITKTPPAAVLIKQALRDRQGLRRAQPGQGRHDHPAAAARDRRAQARRPERPRRRPGREDHRRHRPLDGRGGGAMSSHGRRYTEQLAKVDREREYEPARGDRPRAQPHGRQVRRVDRDPHPHRPERPPRRRAAARDDRAPQRPRQGRQASPSSPRATRSARPKRPEPTSSEATISPNGSRRALTTSTSRSRPPT